MNPPESLLSADCGSVGLGPKLLHWLQVPRQCAGCWPEDHALSWKVLEISQPYVEGEMGRLPEDGSHTEHLRSGAILAED